MPIPGISANEGHEIRLDALGLNGTAIGGIVQGGSQLDARAIGQGDDGLDRSLAEGLFADQNGPLVILERAGHDFRGRGRTGIDQDDQGHIDVVWLGLRFEILLLGGVLALDGNDLAGRQEHIGNVDRLFEQAAGVVAQVEDHTLQRLAGLLVVGQGLLEFGGGILIEPGKADIQHARIDLVALHADDGDGIPHHLDLDGLLLVLVQNGQGHGLALGPPDLLDGVHQGHAGIPPPLQGQGSALHRGPRPEHPRFFRG